MKLRAILFILALLVLLSTFTGGFFYYSSLKKLVVQKAKLECELSVSKYKDHISFLLTEKLREVKALAKANELRQALKNPDETNLRAANSVLVHFNNSLESSVSYLMDKEGNTISSSNFDASDSFVGKNYAFRPYFQKAIKGSSAVYLALGITSGKRGAYFSHPIYDVDNQTPIGIFVIKASADSLEKSLQTHGYNKAIALIVAPPGIIFISTFRPWLYQSLFEIDTNSILEMAETKQFGKGPWGWTGLKQKSNSQIVDKAGNEYVYHQTKIEELPGWIILSMINLEKISKETIDPLIRLSGYIIIVICFFVGISVIILYRMAGSEIFKRKKAEETLRESEEKYRTLFETGSDALFVLDTNSGKILEANQAANELYGYSTEDFMKLNVKDLSVEPKKTGEEVKKTQRTFIPIRYSKKKDGTTFPIEITANIFSWQGKQLNISAVRDITERKRAEEALIKAHNELEKKVEERTADYKRAQEEAERANQLKSEFLANMSHELRTPIHHILSFTQIGIKRFKSQKDRTLDCLEKITSAGNRLMDLINNLFDLSKLETGKMEYSFAENDVFVNINENITGLSHQLEEKGISIVIAQPTVPTKVICDQGKISQVIQNLLSNSIKFSEKEKSISISLDLKNLSFEGRPDGESTILSLLVSIKDEGPGIPDDELDFIFKRFNQSSKTKTGAGGKGLGLTICQEIIKAHNGKIWAENNPEGGATFSFVLPYEQQVVAD